jgi:squalene-hopene/tetraprenyl-beta-curcumene cyclase
VARAADLGIGWLLKLQNDDGGWPTFYRDDTLLHFDESAPDVTAQALRSLAAWRLDPQAKSRAQIEIAIQRGWQYLESQQCDDGSFVPLWFGNVHQPNEQNPVYGTAQVILASADLDRLDSNTAQRAARWLVTSQHANGGWGPPRAPIDYSAAEKVGLRGRRANVAMAQFCTVEETALAANALLPLAGSNPAFSQAISRGLTWLVEAIEQDGHRHPAIIGYALSKLWYDERLYPLAFAGEALTRAIRNIAVETPAASPTG